MEVTLPKQDLELLDQQTPDPVAQENFDRIRVFMDADFFSKFDGNLFEVVLTAAVTNLKIPHNLGFLPTAAWVVFNSGAGSITLNYGSFSNSEIDITTTGAVDSKIVIGAFRSVSNAS